MNDKDTPAFPCLDNNANGYEGMTLRDYFAAKAMQGLLANQRREGEISHFARDAYRFADAMLEARK